jgi:hypothetical protein
MNMEAQTLYQKVQLPTLALSDISTEVHSLVAFGQLLCSHLDAVSCSTGFV